MNRRLIFPILTIVISVVAIIFIRQSNDHKECGTQTEITYSNNGEKMVSEIHICKESFNL